MAADPPLPRPLRLTVVLAGGAALGAYEAGAMAAFLVALRELRDGGADVRLDSITGSSAGALVGYLATMAAMTGRDPVRALRRAWVEDVDAELLRNDDPLHEQLRGASSTAPLHFDELAEGFAELWEDVERGEPLQDAPMVLHVSLTDLGGHVERVDGPRGAATVRAPSFVRDVREVVEPGVDDHGLDHLHDAVFASAANPGAFAARLVDGDWYVDGAMVESRPLQRALECVEELPGEPHVTGDGAGGDRAEDGPMRVVLVIDPRSEDPASVSRWSEADDRPTWLAGLARALAILGTQQLYDDVRAIVDDGDDHLLVDVLDPSLLADGDNEAPGLLAGAFLGDFGGFLDRGLRHSDFTLGWATFLQWATDVLPALEVDEALAEHVLERLRDAHDHDWRAANEGEARAEALDTAARWAATKLALEAVTAAGRTVLSGPLSTAGQLVASVRSRLDGIGGD